MNDKPHSHLVQIDNAHDTDRKVVIGYGDQTVKCTNKAKTIRKAAEKLIARHDRESAKAGKRAEKLAALELTNGDGTPARIYSPTYGVDTRPDEEKNDRIWWGSNGYTWPMYKDAYLRGAGRGQIVSSGPLQQIEGRRASFTVFDDLQVEKPRQLASLNAYDKRMAELLGD